MTELRWDEQDARWRWGPARRRAPGPLRRAWRTVRSREPSCPGSRASRRFQGHTFHTSRWDYDYTGGDASGGPRPACATSGSASSARAPPRCSACRTSGESAAAPVRLPAHALVGRRARQPRRRIRSGWPSLEPGWQQRRIDNFGRSSSRAASRRRTSSDDGWTDIIRNLSGHGCERATSAARPKRSRRSVELADFEKMEEIRARVDELVSDPKRPPRRSSPGTGSSASVPASTTTTCRPSTGENVTLVDTDGKGVEQITEGGVVVARRRVRGRLPHLRHGLRGGHRLLPPRRLRHRTGATASACSRSGRRRSRPSTAC